MESGRQEMVEGGHLLDGTGKTNWHPAGRQNATHDHVSMAMPYCLLQIK